MSEQTSPNSLRQEAVSVQNKRHTTTFIVFHERIIKTDNQAHVKWLKPWTR